MRKLKQALCILMACTMLSSCATLFGGKVTEYQKTRPAAGEPQRELRIGAFIADLLIFWPSLAVDFATGAIYKPKAAASK
ncbi:hypothetical protein [Adhaeribacter radiodurans]|uniref:YceK/YidQ family lipoprotein n=2 Tax=Adhaeribacter TaxID=299566 RepID=A0A7L7LEP8_9BACT|nr:hypothetical protein [Adhaeribacter radiodurans]QMU31154.1 hypothetical protein HUW48_25400 [Adhaeribacter radiodurans]